MSSAVTGQGENWRFHKGRICCISGYVMSRDRKLMALIQCNTMIDPIYVMISGALSCCSIFFLVPDPSADLDFSFLEMNPFTLVNGEPFPLDMRGELDDTAAFKNFNKYASVEYFRII